MNITAKVGWIAAATLGVFVVAAFAGVVRAGPLDPPASPAPSMVTQNELPPAWHQDLSATGGCSSARFGCVLGTAAVLDRETGLVWERTPSTLTSSWSGAVSSCLSTAIGGKKGWRLATAEELGSLFGTGGPPAGHPFNTTVADYWSSTTNAADPTQAWVVRSGNGGFVSFPKTTSLVRWCVRGESGHDGY